MNLFIELLVNYLSTLTEIECFLLSTPISKDPKYPPLFGSSLKPNIAPENWWLEDVLLFFFFGGGVAGMAYFQGLCY